MTKAFYVAGIIGTFLFISIFLGYMGYSYTGITGYDVTTGTTPDLPNTIGDAFWDGMGFILGALIFQVPNIPIWLNLFIWLFTLALIFMVIEIARGV